MPAGSYYIGDPCYVMHDVWEEVCDTIRNGNGEFTLSNGVRFAAYGTAHGDGSYATNIGATLDVDAGLIGCIKLEDINYEDESNQVSFGTAYYFDKPFTTTGKLIEARKWDGVIHIGGVKIYTEDCYYEDYYELEDDNDY